MIIKIEENVKEFLNQKAKEYGTYAENIFHYSTWNYIDDINMESPIEQLLFISLLYLQKINDIDDFHINKEKKSRGFYIESQRKIGKYYVDFYCEYYGPKKSKKIIIECDSKQWHDRNEKDRIYEKSRERKFVSDGFNVMRFTGSEIFKDSIKCAKQIMLYLTELDEDCFMTDNNLGEIE